MTADKSVCPEFDALTSRANLFDYSSTAIPGVLIEARKRGGEIEYRLNDVPCASVYVKATMLKAGRL